MFDGCFSYIQWSRRCLWKLCGVDYAWPCIRDIPFLSMKSIHKPVITDLNILRTTDMCVCVVGECWTSLMIIHYFKWPGILWHHDPITDTQNSAINRWNRPYPMVRFLMFEIPQYSKCWVERSWLWVRKVKEDLDPQRTLWPEKPLNSSYTV